MDIAGFSSHAWRPKLIHFSCAVGEVIGDRRSQRAIGEFIAWQSTGSGCHTATIEVDDASAIVKGGFQRRTLSLKMPGESLAPAQIFATAKE
jgi:hypothetical protein